MNKDTKTRAASAPELADLAAEIDSLLSVADLARLLGKSEQSVRNMRFKGLLPEPRRIPGFGLRWTPEQIRCYLEGSRKPLPDSWGVLYDREHIDGVGGVHDEGMWIPLITEGGCGGRTLISDSALRRHGYDVPPFTGTPCPKCFPEGGDKGDDV